MCVCGCAWEGEGGGAGSDGLPAQGSAHGSPGPGLSLGPLSKLQMEAWGGSMDPEEDVFWVGMLVEMVV